MQFGDTVLASKAHCFGEPKALQCWIGEEMSKKLEKLLELARKHEITPEERDAQVRSFAYGNTHFENEAITKADIDNAMKSLQTERESPDRS